MASMVKIEERRETEVARNSPGDGEDAQHARSSRRASSPMRGRPIVVIDGDDGPSCFKWTPPTATVGDKVITLPVAIPKGDNSGKNYDPLRGVHVTKYLLMKGAFSEMAHRVEDKTTPSEGGPPASLVTTMSSSAPTTPSPLARFLERETLHAQTVPNNGDDSDES